MTLAEDNKILNFYQDFDSVHMMKKNINVLSDLFRKKYQKESIGENMGQFHSDFEMDGCTNVISVASIFLGKKSYIDVLEGTDKIINEFVIITFVVKLFRPVL